VQERNIEPSLDRAAVDDDVLQPLEKRRRKDVVEYVDFQRHGVMDLRS
jgi:hypothetical protein